LRVAARDVASWHARSGFELPYVSLVVVVAVGCNKLITELSFLQGRSGGFVGIMLICDWWFILDAGLIG